MDTSGSQSYHGLILPAPPQFERRPSGHILVDDGHGEVVVADTKHCVHCGAHWISVKDSGRIIGWCYGCDGYICGAKCAEHYPMEKKLEDFEAGRLAVLA